MNSFVRSLVYRLQRGSSFRLSSSLSRTILTRSFSESKEKVIASKSTKGVKRQIPVIDQLKRGSQKISVKNMVYLLLVTNVILVGLVINKKRKNDQHLSQE